MGLEGYIVDVLEANEISRSIYYFEFGLKTDTKEHAERIAEILNESGQFAPADAFFQGGLDSWGVRFDSPLRKVTK